VAQLASDRAIVIGHFPKPKTRSLHIPIDDLARAHNPIRDVIDEESTLAFHDRVLQGDHHRRRLSPP